MADSGSDEESGVETLSRMQKRHKKEQLAAQKAAKQLGKKREAEASALLATVSARHAEELAARSAAAAEASALPAAPAAATEPPAVEAAAAALAAASLQPQQSKAQKRRAKAAKEEAEREARIASELQAAGPSTRLVEEEALKAVLAPLGLRVREIRADGHCLYRSVEDQLSRWQAGPPDVAALRAATAAWMRAHPDDYLPFLELEEGDGDGFERYCAEVADSAAWGGQLELGALAAALRRRVTVYSARLPPVEMGSEWGGDSLLLAYHQHAFGLGEHYNSVRPDEAA